MSREGRNGHTANGIMQSPDSSCLPSPPSTGFALGHTPPLVDSLTPREEEVLDLLAQEGLTNRELAERLVVTEWTIWRHLSNIYGKLGVRSRSEAIVWATRHCAAREEDT